VKGLKGNCKQYLAALKKMTSTVLLKHGKNYGITVYIPKETILKKMTAKIKLSQLLFFSPSPETF
jgi:hypothetical protein